MIEMRLAVAEDEEERWLFYFQFKLTKHIR